ncbi:hypothetical protein BDV33DRAFT_204801 [Aspergillus novoparasiticus]|uniref:Fe2OG dioxygenase domain-containing protein n=1 Tax=Aspergillus novoparasiticus TaxID=986946 RepID=A0A5N6EQS4_9EURO|nr:hypothetical protein BDV33DRAFT_204801 [Aspergillus novoparasiticus]
MSTQTYTQIELLSANGTVLRRVSTAGPRLPTEDETPIIDLAPIDGTLGERKALASRIKAASENTGFFNIRNHGIPNELIQNSLSQAKTFFDQPLNLKETFSMRYDPRIDPTCTDPRSALGQGKFREDGDYIWKGTSHLPGFREVTVSFWQSRLALARKLVCIFALALGEREDNFDDITSHPGADALYIHYPGIPDVAADSDIDVGIGSHTDIQCFTLLWQDNSGGLQVLSAQDEWLDARPIEGTLVVNIGDFLQGLSNNKFKSTVHGVYNRQLDSRYSMPFFFGFNPEAVCKVVPSCVDDEHPPLYEPISCGEETCREDDSKTESFSSDEYNVRFTTKLDAPLPDIEEAVSACSESSLALTPSAWLREGVCPVLDSESVTPAAAERCGLKPLAQELAASVSTAMLNLMECPEGTWQTIQQPCLAKEESIGMPRRGSGPGLVWAAVLAAVASLLL